VISRSSRSEDNLARKEISKKTCDSCRSYPYASSNTKSSVILDIITKLLCTF